RNGDGPRPRAAEQPPRRTSAFEDDWDREPEPETDYEPDYEPGYDPDPAPDRDFDDAPRRRGRAGEAE
ncbi:hypothetical protein GTW71_18650, partial [Streptomyces sp. SID6041]|nr:hypothetical protein [Streptomyces sp. SID6041]